MVSNCKADRASQPGTRCPQPEHRPTKPVSQRRPSAPPLPAPTSPRWRAAGGRFRFRCKRPGRGGGKMAAAVWVRGRCDLSPCSGPGWLLSLSALLSVAAQGVFATTHWVVTEDGKIQQQVVAGASLSARPRPGGFPADPGLFDSERPRPRSTFAWSGRPPLATPAAPPPTFISTWSPRPPASSPPCTPWAARRVDRVSRLRGGGRARVSVPRDFFSRSGFRNHRLVIAAAGASLTHCHQCKAGGSTVPAVCASPTAVTASALAACGSFNAVSLGPPLRPGAIRAGLGGGGFSLNSYPGQLGNRSYRDSTLFPSEGMLEDASGGVACILADVN